MGRGTAGVKAAIAAAAIIKGQRMTSAKNRLKMQSYFVLKMPLLLFVFCDAKVNVHDLRFCYSDAWLNIIFKCHLAFSVFRFM